MVAANEGLAEAKAKFSWVIARQACSAEQVFGRLKDQVDQDVKARSSIRHERHDTGKFELAANANDFTVFGPPRRFVKFTLLDGARILVEGEGVEFVATPIMNNDGECRLRVKEEELQEWQVSRLALEDVFFAQQ